MVYSVAENYASALLHHLGDVANGNDPRMPIPQTFIFGKNGKVIDSLPGLRGDFRSWAEGAINHALSST